MPLPTRPLQSIQSFLPGVSESSTRWMLTSAAGAVAASLLARSLLERGWRTVRDEDPPNEVVGSSNGWPQALAWGAATGLVVGVARIVGRRAAAAAWEKTTDRPPPV